MGAIAAVEREPRDPPRPDEIDELTLARACRGDPTACQSFVTRYQRPVFGLLSRVLGARHASLVEDLAQETFLRAFRALPTFDARRPGRLSTWILTIASRLALDELRRRRADSEPLESGARLHTSEASADAAAHRHEIERAIVRAMNGLGADARAVFVLREIHGLEYAEIAAALQVDMGTVKSRLSRARVALRVALAEVHDD
ncbi:MAG: sigma-70 family RNA polymerase sigma factor [Deltaproteobacteria bacterium]|nr:sigma-70 family RNA polymerase sigma factor [Deltaproteobacteria bacterium]